MRRDPLYIDIGVSLPRYGINLNPRVSNLFSIAAARARRRQAEPKAAGLQPLTRRGGILVVANVIEWNSVWTKLLGDSLFGDGQYGGLRAEVWYVPCQLSGWWGFSIDASIGQVGLGGGPKFTRLESNLGDSSELRLGLGQRPWVEVAVRRHWPRCRNSATPIGVSSTELLHDIRYPLSNLLRVWNLCTETSETSCKVHLTLTQGSDHDIQTGYKGGRIEHSVKDSRRGFVPDPGATLSRWRMFQRHTQWHSLDQT